MELLLDRAVRRLREAQDWAHLDRLEQPVYAVDRNAVFTYSNPAFAALTGVTPQPGRDRWGACLTVRDLAGAPVAMGGTPMAVCLRERRPVRGVVLCGERRDGSRFYFQPYPTPLFDAAGDLAGALNLLVEVPVQRARELALRAKMGPILVGLMRADKLMAGLRLAVAAALGLVLCAEAATLDMDGDGRITERDRVLQHGAVI